MLTDRISGLCLYMRAFPCFCMQTCVVPWLHLSGFLPGGQGFDTQTPVRWPFSSPEPQLPSVQAAEAALAEKLHEKLAQLAGIHDPGNFKQWFQRVSSTPPPNQNGSRNLLRTFSKGSRNFFFQMWGWGGRARIFRYFRKGPGKDPLCRNLWPFPDWAVYGRLLAAPALMFTQGPP